MLKSARNLLWRGEPVGDFPRDRVGLGDRLGLGGLLLFAFAASPFPNLATLGLLALLCGFIVAHNRNVPKTDPLVVLMGALMLSLSVSVFVGWQLFPRNLQDHVSGALYLLLFPFLVLLVAWALKGDIRRVYWALAAALSGLILAIVAPLLIGGVDWQEILAGRRHSMMFSNPIRLGLYAAAALLGMFVWRPTWGGGYARFAGKLLGYVVLAVILAEALLISQSRAVWIAALVVLPTAAVALLFLSASRQGQIAKSGLLSLALAAALVAATVYVSHELVERRWAEAAPTIQAAIDGEPVRYDSFGIRYHMWQLGLSKFAERPLFGHGAGSVPEYLRAQTSHLSEFNSLHSMYVDLVVRFGLVGFLLAMTVFLVLLISVIRAWRRDQINERMAVFLVGALTLFLIDGLSTYTLEREQGRFYMALVGGIAYTWRLWGNSVHNKVPAHAETKSSTAQARSHS